MPAHRPTTAIKYCACGVEISSTDNQCRQCYFNRIRAPVKYCKCGKRIWHGYTQCRQCYFTYLHINKIPEKIRREGIKQRGRIKYDPHCIDCNTPISFYTVRCRKCQNHKHAIQQVAKRFHLSENIVQQHWRFREGDWRRFYIRYSGGKCSLCGFADVRALQVDHIKGNGSQLRKEIGNKIGDLVFRQPTDHRVLCANCNWISRHELRHEKTIEERAKAIKVLGGACIKCGFTNPFALQIDHIQGGGTAERKAIRSEVIYRKVVNGAIDYQLLCANCNWIKRSENNEQSDGGKARRLAAKLGKQ